jgi:hypothetical protein
MRNKLLIALVLLFSFNTSIASAEMFLFMRADCSHCTNLESELQQKNAYETFQITPYDISQNEDNMMLYLNMAKETGYKNGGVPLLIDGDEAIEGRGPILSHLKLNEVEVPEATTLSAETSDLLNDIIKEEKTPANFNPTWIFFIFPLVVCLLYLGKSSFMKKS